MWAQNSGSVKLHLVLWRHPQGIPGCPGRWGDPGAHPAQVALPPGCSVIIYADQHRFSVPQLPFCPKGLISYLFPNYNLTLLERAEFLMPKAGRAHLALSRDQGPMAFPLSASPSLLKTNKER